MQRVLVTGVEFMLGSSLAQALSSRCEVLGAYSQGPLESPAFGTSAWNPAKEASLADLLSFWQPQWIIHCPSLSASSWDIDPARDDLEREPADAARLAAAAAAHGCPLTVVASDAVFSGPRMFHDESSAPQCVTLAARQCLAMEAALAASPALVVRTHAYGWSRDDGPRCFAQETYDSLRRGQLPRLEGRRYATPILASDLADLLWQAHQTRLQGLFHLAGAERTSMQRFVREMAACLGVHYPDSRLGQAEPDWHEETSLSSLRARRALARPTPTLREGLERFIAQADGQSRPSWCARPSSIEAAA